MKFGLTRSRPHSGISEYHERLGEIEDLAAEFSRAAGVYADLAALAQLPEDHSRDLLAISQDYQATADGLEDEARVWS